MSIDMHIHTTASDGADTPARVVALAVKTGLTAIAITDHDTFSGVEPATAAGLERGLMIIPGIELSAEKDGSDVHILGYMPDMNDTRLLDKIAMFRRQRGGRIGQMVNKLSDIGLNVELERVLAIAGDGAAGRPHLAAAMVEAGLVSDIKEAFNKYIGKGLKAYVPRYKITPAEAVQMIRQARGIPVLAHPGSGVAGKIIPELTEAGLLGIEACHPSHSTSLTKHYLELGKRHGLIITGGSDYHGLERKKGHCLGMISVPDSVLEEMRRCRRM